MGYVITYQKQKLQAFEGIGLGISRTENHVFGEQTVFWQMVVASVEVHEFRRLIVYSFHKDQLFRKLAPRVYVEEEMCSLILQNPS